MTVPDYDYYLARKRSPHFPTIAELEARREARNEFIGNYMLRTAYLLVGGVVLALVLA
jgi:uncharacterized short protein YbdD (DUF466 family)